MTELLLKQSKIIHNWIIDFPIQINQKDLKQASDKVVLLEKFKPTIGEPDREYSKIASMNRFWN